MSLLDDALRKAREKRRPHEWEPIIVDKKGGKKKPPLLPLSILGAIVILLGIGFFVLKNPEKNKETAESEDSNKVVIIVEESSPSPPVEITRPREQEKEIEVSQKEKTTATVKKEKPKKSVKKPEAIVSNKKSNKKRNKSEARRLYRYALDMERKGNLKEAALAYEKALKVDPDFFEARLNLSALYIELGYLTEAERNLNILKAGAHEDMRVRFNLALLQYKRGNNKRAKTYLFEILDRNPRHFEASLLLARMYEEGNNLDSALYYYERCLTTRRTPELLLRAGRLSDLLGLKDKAVSYYEAYLKTGKDEKIAESVRKRLAYLKES